MKSQVRAHEKSCPVITPSLWTSCKTTVQDFLWLLFKNHTVHTFWEGHKKQCQNIDGDFFSNFVAFCDNFNFSLKFKYWYQISWKKNIFTFPAIQFLSFFRSDFQKWKDPLMQSNSIDIFVANHHFLCTRTAPGQKCEFPNWFSRFHVFLFSWFAEIPKPIAI